MPAEREAVNQMDVIALQADTDLSTDLLPDGWARLCYPNDSTGVVLDPVLHAIWSASMGRTPGEIARFTGVSVHLASYALAALARAGLLSQQLGTPQNQVKNPGHRPGLLPRKKPLGAAAPKLPLAIPPRPQAVASWLFPVKPEQPPARLPISALIVHSDAEANLERCIESVMRQEQLAPGEIRVIATAPFDPDIRMVPIVTCEADKLASTVVDQLSMTSDDASLLLLESQVTLTPGALAEMARALELPGQVAAVAPRVMWRRWSAFVAHIGDWQRVSTGCANPYAGHLDLGQFRRRWQEVPAFYPACGLISAEALREIGMPKGSDGAEYMWSEWCRRARNTGYHILAATQALAHGPGSGPHNPPRAGRDRTRLRTVQAKGMLLPGPGPLLHAQAPALTVDSVRGIYSQYPAIVPAPVRPRIAFVATETRRPRGIARALSQFCDVDWLVPGVSTAKLLRPLCESADMVITTAEVLEEVAFLQGWHRPIIVDMQPPVSWIKTPELWPQAFDGLICATDEEHQYWLAKVSACRHGKQDPDPRLPMLAEMIMVVPTGIDPCSPPNGQTLRAIHPEVGSNDKVVLWYGGLQSFSDPQTAIHALAAMLPTLENLKLVIAELEDSPQDKDTVWVAMEQVDKLGLAQSVLFAQDIPAHMRQVYLDGADIAISLGIDTLQARLHEPAGLAECIGANLPIVITAGHAGAALIQHLGVGRAVPAGDVAGLAQTLAECLQVPAGELSDQFAAATEIMAWSSVIAPLADICQQPDLASERETTILLERDALFASGSGPTPLGGLTGKAWRSLRRQGLRATTSELFRYALWRIGA